MLYNKNQKKGTSKMQVSDEIVNQMLRNLPQDQQRIMSGILTDEITHEVICNSQDVFENVEVETTDKKGKTKTVTEKRLVQEGVKGRVIAYITNQGQIIPTTTEDGITFLRSSRKRTDGEWGFESWCGTDSRIAPNEQGILHANGQQPSKDDLYAMAERLQQNPPKYVTINGEREVDGFIIREVRK